MANLQDKHLLYYQREMSFLRQMGGIFAAKYPKIAKRLGFNEYQSNDPHVERLIESFAYLTSYLQKDIDDQFPRIASALLSVLYPQQTTLIPSMSIAHFEAETKGSGTGLYHIPKKTPLVTESTTGEKCHFQTCYPVELWPLEVSDLQLVKLSQYDFATVYLSQYAYALKISLSSAVPLKSLDIKKLRFFLNAPQTEAFTLYHLLFEDDAPAFLLKNDLPVFLPKDSLKPVGFREEEEVIPCPKNGHRAYGLLQEYFSFSKKFMFFDVENLSFDTDATTIDLFIPLLHGTEARTMVFHKKMLLLGCTPIINLFSKISEPIRLNHQKIEYRLIADHRRENTTEIHSIESVFTSGTDEVEVKELSPYFSYNHHSLQGKKNSFWSARRIPSTNPHIPGMDMMISFVDLDMVPSQSATDVAYARIFCTNRQLAPTLSANTILYAAESSPPVRSIICLEQPTEPLYPPEEGSTQWQLISQLSLNHLSFSSAPESLEALKEILMIYAGSKGSSHEAEINRLKTMTCETVLRRMGKDAWRGFVRGTAITLTIDDGGSPALGSLLFMSVLSRFFGLYANINSFSELSVKLMNQEGIWKRWTPTVGSQSLF